MTKWKIVLEQLQTGVVRLGGLLFLAEAHYMSGKSIVTAARSQRSGRDAEVPPIAPGFRRAWAGYF